MSVSGLSEQIGSGFKGGDDIRQLSRTRTWALLLIVLLPYLGLVFLHRGIEGPAASGDWAQYVLHAKALVEGKPYTETGYIFTQLNWTIGPRAYPPGFPLTLAPFLAFGDSALTWMRATVALSGAAFLVLAFLRLRLSVNPWIAALSAMWCGVVVELAFASVSILSDLGFAMLCWLTIYLADRPGEWSWKRTALVAASGLAAASYRVPGIALVAAMVPYALLNWRQASRQVAAILGFWFLISLGAIIVAPSLLPATLLPDELSQFVSRFTTNLLALRYPLFDATAYPSTVDWLNDAYHAVAAIVVLIGASAGLRKTFRSFMTSFVVVYTGLILVAPVSDTRYFWPIYPVLACCFLQGIVILASKARALSGNRAIALAGGVAAVVLLAAFGRSQAMPVPSGFDKQPDALALSDYVRDAGARGEITRIAFTNPRVIALKTNIPAMGLFPGTPRAIISELHAKHISHIVVGEFGSPTCGNMSMAGSVEAYPSAFEPVVTFGRFALYKFTAPDSTQMGASALDDDPERLDVCVGI